MVRPEGKPPNTVKWPQGCLTISSVESRADVLVSESQCRSVSVQACGCSFGLEGSVASALSCGPRSFGQAQLCAYSCSWGLVPARCPPSGSPPVG